MSKAVSAMQSLSKTIEDDTKAIAALLSQPVSDSRATAIAELWNRVDAARDQFAEGVPAIHPSKRDPDDAPDDEEALQVRLDLMRNGDARLRLWPKVADLLARQAVPRDPLPLVTEGQQYSPKRDSDLASYMMTLLHNFANAAAHDRSKSIQGQHLDIGLSGAYYINLLQAAYRLAMAQGRTGPLTFLDVGCGGGSKVMVAAAFFDAAHGIEYNDTFVANAKIALDTVKAQGCKITQGDALTFDDYGDYDVIYFYRPISDEEQLTEMETRIVTQARPGTILIAPYPFCLSTTLADHVCCIADKVYVTQTSEKAAALLRDKAEQIGPDHPLCDEFEASVQGFFAPIIAASRANGFGIPPSVATSVRHAFG